jgi:hypothetical protein
MPNKLFTSSLANLEFIKQKRSYTNISEVLYRKIKDGLPNVLNLPNDAPSVLSNGAEFRLISFFKAVLLSKKQFPGPTQPLIRRVPRVLQCGGYSEWNVYLNTRVRIVPRLLMSRTIHPLSITLPWRAEGPFFTVWKHNFRGMVFLKRCTLEKD